MKKNILYLARFSFIWLFVFFRISALAEITETWNIILSKSLLQDEAIKSAISDLQTMGEKFNITFKTVDENSKIAANSIIVGDTARNRLTAALVRKKQVELQGVDHEQGYQIQTKMIGGHKINVIAGGSVIGDVYGLYWLWDRLRVYGRIPDINITRLPALPIRISLAWGRRGSGGESKDQMRDALRYSINWVSGPPILDLVPWDSEPEASRNALTRQRAHELINYAHSLHMNYFSFANEFTFHSSSLEKFAAGLSPCDPCFWDALQEKYRSLFQALPELDGIEICNDDISGFWDDYRAYDVMHETPECEWPLDKRFRTFVKKVYNVVVNEFDKTYFHFTWSLVSYEQHNQPNIFRKIFTADVPVKNLYLIPKITAADRWWHQPYNPTFNLTPHNTIVGFETMNYYESSRANIFPTFAGQYYQAGLQTFLRPKETNVMGSGYIARSAHDGWDTRNLTSYILFRLSWDPDEDIAQIARDFCAIHFGTQAAEKMAEIYLLSPVAYKYGLHIEPVSYGQFNSFIHMRVGTFPAMGYPSIDGGKEHLDFLQQIYLRCKPWKAETYMYLDHGLKTAKTMVENFAAAKPLIADPQLAQSVENSLNMTKLLIQTNVLYVKAAFTYFAYWEKPTPALRDSLMSYYSKIVDTRQQFVAAPEFGYQLFGVDQLIANVEQALEDLPQAQRRLQQAPTRKQIERTITEQQQKYQAVLREQAGKAVKLAHVEVEIDGRDILHINGDRYQIEHLRWDQASVRECSFFEKLPQQELTVIPKDLYSRPAHPFVLEHPSEQNDYTAKIYLYDAPGGKDWMKFDLYYIPSRPEDLGLDIPWMTPKMETK